MSLKLARLDPDRAPGTNAALTARLELLERAIDTLKGRKEAMDIDVYFVELKLLLLQMASAERDRQSFTDEEITRPVRGATDDLGSGLLPQLKSPVPVRVKIELPRLTEQVPP